MNSYTINTIVCLSLLIHLTEKLSFQMNSNTQHIRSFFKHSFSKASPISAPCCAPPHSLLLLQHSCSHAWACCKRVPQCHLCFSTRSMYFNILWLLVCLICSTVNCSIISYKCQHIFFFHYQLSLLPSVQNVCSKVTWYFDWVPAQGSLYVNEFYWGICIFH